MQEENPYSTVMAAFKRQDAILLGGEVTNAAITQCSITMSEPIDMGTNKIINVADPTLSGDAVNLGYLQANAAIVVTATLSGSTYTTISTDTFGSFVITVTPNVANGPGATFHVTKNAAGKYPHIVSLTRMRGDATNEALELAWNPSSDLQLRKNGTGYDGSYIVKIM